MTIELSNQVGKCLYKLPKRNLQYSKFFSSIFGPPTPGPREKLDSCKSPSTVRSTSETLGNQAIFRLNGAGESEEDPINLSGVGNDAFDAFLSIVYPT